MRPRKSPNDINGLIGNDIHALVEEAYKHGYPTEEVLIALASSAYMVARQGGVSQEGFLSICKKLTDTAEAALGGKSDA